MFLGRSKLIPLFRHLLKILCDEETEAGITRECTPLIILARMVPRSYVVPRSHDLRK